ncbi:MAG: DEAD/DEAH box helicase [Inconstantimicrobium porci]|uniref:DEAD/DEAH box helicase n=1 Tax=Inconstantimicrobium porci TaxID=2652291 RepID=UPI002A913765|nr:DEAD/DEAH box helicase [Inconstantimicrobium porci]MDY5913283.1 DEAD/DEAH box helicase [Inconstantimicrobium porci]
MIINDLENIITKHSSSSMRKNALCVLKSSSIKLTGKAFKEFYSIYGRVDDNDVYVKINTSKSIIEKVSCTCSLHRSYNGNKIFMCSHIIACLYKFINYNKKVAKKKVDNKKRLEKNSKPQQIKSQTITTQKESKPATDNRYIKIKRIKNNDNVFYECRKFPYKNKEIIKDTEIKEYVLSLGDRIIKFTYDYIEVSCKAKNKNLDLYFTVKEDDESLIVTTHKKLPLSLSSDNDIFFYNNDIFVPSSKQLKYYLPLYDELKAKNVIKRHLTIEDFESITDLLFKVSKNVDIREEVREFVFNLSTIELNLYDENGEIYCDAYVKYFSKKYNLLDMHDRKYESILIKLESHNFPGNGNRLKFTGNDDDLFNILTKQDSAINSIGNVNLSSSLRKMILGNDDISLNIDNDDDRLFMTYDIKGLSREEILQAYESYKNGNRYFKTSSHFLDLEDDAFISLFNIIDICEENENDRLEIDEDKELYVFSASKNINKVRGIDNLNHVKEILSCDYAVPDNLNATLKEYQEDGFKFLKRLYKLGFGGILADEMGLGKTIQTITFLLSEESRRFLIVSPSSLIYNWKSEIEKFAPSLKVGIIYGVRRIDVLNSYEEYDVLLTTYTTLKADLEAYKDKFFDVCIIDEAQNIKNYKSQAAEAVKSVNSNVNFALTGTPIENNITELWSIFDFVNSGYLGTIEEFKNKYSYNIELLKSMTEPFILRRTKSEVNIGLKEKKEKIKLIPMTRNQRILYNSYVKSIKNELRMSKNSISILTYLTKLREICLDPALIDDEYDGGSGKINELLKIVNMNKKKMLIFSQFTAALDNIEEELKKLDIKCFRIDGKTPSKTRIKRVNEFNSFQGEAIFLISLKAGGTGLNLTSASTVIHFDPWWNPASEDQATDRAHRIGQKSQVNVIKLIAKSTIEEKIVLLQNEKKSLINDILSSELSDANRINKLSNEEILKLLF